MKLIVLLILITLFNSLSSLSRKCTSLFESYIHPYYCCEYPIADTKQTSSDFCYEQCANVDDFCCVYDCIYKEMKYFNNGKMTVGERVEHYKADIETRKGIKEKWEGIVKESIEDCEKIGEEVELFSHFLDFNLKICEILNHNSSPESLKLIQTFPYFQ